jgi:coenzyme PQQ synthesis protein D (PqqD)
MRTEIPKVANNVSYTVIDGEAIVINIDSGKYLGLNRAATRMLELLATVRDLDEIVKTLLAEFRVDEDTIRRDLDRFIEDATNRRILVT